MSAPKNTKPPHKRLMNSLSNFIEGVAHEVNNSLSTIRLAGEVIVEDLDQGSPEELPDADFLREKLTNIIREVDRARSFMAELFQVSRTKGIESEPLSLKALLNRALAAQSGISDQIQVEMTVEDDLIITADEPMMTTAFANVISDALSAIKGAGSLVIRACRQRNGVVEVSVTNSGKALSEPEMERIFEPFFSTKKAGRGKGLGLFVPCQIVKTHNGTIHAERSISGGTTIRLTLPSWEGGG